MRQRLGIAIALCGDPDFIILDEPTNGLDPQGIIDIRELILKLNKERGITFLISSHILGELSKLASCYGFIDKGHIVREMSAEELRSECRKSIRMTVSDIEGLKRVMKKRGFEYEIVDETSADVYSDITVSEMAKAFEEENCSILTLTENEEDLESFYLELLGGDEDA
jgi:ABC-type multidrug transport system, ATPase component